MSFGFFAFVAACLIWIGIGAVFILDPQTMFRIRYFPPSPNGDGLTEEGENSYKWHGWFIIATGVIMLLVALTQ